MGCKMCWNLVKAKAYIRGQRSVFLGSTGPLHNGFFGRKRRMTQIQDYFTCGDCGNKEFKAIYRFSLRFHKVNFADDLIYDDLTEELYQCTGCGKTFTKPEIHEGLAAIKRARRQR